MPRGKAGDGVDNDGDGKIDGFDPECTGPCDDDEGSFQTGIPGDNVDCKQDCFFDGNSGQGGGDCTWDLTCDPSNPGANIGCAYAPGDENTNKCSGQDTGCEDYCGQFTPPGCDCFGCCTVDLGNGMTEDIFLGSGGDCSLQNIEACQSCTKVTDCGNDCDPNEPCEPCFGEALPPECNEPVCDNNLSCTDNSACAGAYQGQDGYCWNGCCTPPSPVG